MNIVNKLRRLLPKVTGVLTAATGASTFLRSDGTWQPAGESAGIPAGIVCMWSGTLAAIPSGWNLCDGTNGTPDLRDRFIKGAGAAENPGATGGSATHSHGVGTFATSAHAGAAVDDHPSHTHTYSQIVNHTHPVTDPGHVHAQRRNNTATGANTGWTTAFDTSSSNPVNDANTGTASATTGITTANPAGGVAQGTTDGPSATLSHAVTQPNNHTMSGTSEAAASDPAFYKLAFIQKAA